MISIYVKRIFIALLASASLCFAQGNQAIPRNNRPGQRASVSLEQSTNPSSFVQPNFLLPENPDVNDYRPVLNAEGTTVIFERNPTATPNDIKLHTADLATGNVQPFVNFASTRPDWCWNRSGGQFTSGPVAFSNNDGIYHVDPGGQPVLLLNTGGYDLSVMVSRLPTCCC